MRRLCETRRRMSFPEEGFAMMPTVDKEYSRVWLTKCFDYSKSGFSIAINMSSCAKVSTVMAPSGRPSKQARFEKVAYVSGILKGVFGPIGWKPRYKASEAMGTAFIEPSRWHYQALQTLTPLSERIYSRLCLKISTCPFLTTLPQQKACTEYFILENGPPTLKQSGR